MKRFAVLLFMAMAAAGTAQAGPDVHYNGDDLDACEMPDSVDLNTQIMACTRLIQAAEAANDQGSIQEFHTHRGEDYLSRDDCSKHGECDLAIGDLTRALEISPLNQEVLGERAIAYDLGGQWVNAVGDRRKELAEDDAGLDEFRLASEYVLGRDEFVIGQYADAARDLATFLKDPELKDSPSDSDTMDYLEGILWLHLARARAGTPDVKEFSQYATHLAAIKEWSGPLYALYLGKTTEKKVFAAAPDSRGDRCYANFWVGEYELLQKDKGAAQHLAAARKLCWAPNEAADPYSAVAKSDLQSLSVFGGN